MNQDQEVQCVEFLQALGIETPDHALLRNPHFFPVFIKGLTPEDVGGKSSEIDSARWQQLLNLIADAGADRMRELLAAAPSSGTVKTPADPPPRPHTPPPPSRSSSSTAIDRSAISPSSATAVKRQAMTSSDMYRKKVFDREVHVQRPTEADRERRRRMVVPESVLEALAMANDLAREGRPDDAIYVILEALNRHGLEEKLVRCASEIIFNASRHNREKGIPPVNLLYECEKLAEMLDRKIPDMSRLVKVKDEQTSKLYFFVRLIYKTWTSHCMALLTYKFQINNRELMKRNWIDPMEFVFLLEPMRMGIRSRLPLDLLRFIYNEIHRCIELGVEVIAHKEKKAKFLGDALRIIASPSKDVIPDLTFQIFREITMAYMEEGDFQNALTFCKQALMVHHNDGDMLRLKEEIMHAAHRSRR